MYYKTWRKPLLVMYHDNYMYGTGLYVPTVNSLDSRNRDLPYLTMPYMPISSPPPPAPRVVDYDLYAPISFGYGRNLLKPRQPPAKQEETPRSRLSSRYYPSFYGTDEM